MLGWHYHLEREQGMSETSGITEQDIDDRGVRRMARAHPSPVQYSCNCEYCGLRMSDLPGVCDCQCDPAGSGFPRVPRDSDYATRCAVCDSAVRIGLTGGPELRGWVHVWPGAERNEHRAELA